MLRLHGTDKVAPAHALARVVRGHERIAVHTPQHPRGNPVSFIETPAEFGISIEHQCAEAVQVSKSSLHQAFERLILQRQRRHPRRRDYRALLANGQGDAGTGKEIVERCTDPAPLVRSRFHRPQSDMRRTEVSLRTAKPSFHKTG